MHHPGSHKRLCPTQIDGQIGKPKKKDTTITWTEGLETVAKLLTAMFDFESFGKNHGWTISTSAPGLSSHNRVNRGPPVKNGFFHNIFGCSADMARFIFEHAWKHIWVQWTQISTQKTMWNVNLGTFEHIKQPTFQNYETTKGRRNWHIFKLRIMKGTCTK